MPDDRSRSRAMVLAAKTKGVISIGITGDLKDRLEVVGDGIDITCLVKRLRKKLCQAEVLKVEEVKDKKEKDKPGEHKPCACSAAPCQCTSYCYTPCRTPMHMAFYDDEEPRGLCHIL